MEDCELKQVLDHGTELACVTRRLTRGKLWAKSRIRVRYSKNRPLFKTSQSIFAPETFTALPHLSISARRKTASSFGVDDSRFAPSSCSRCCTSGVAMDCTSAKRSFSMIAGGVPAGATRQYHVAMSNPGSPDSL